MSGFNIKGLAQFFLVVISIFINANLYGAAIGLELVEYVDLNGHPKMKDINFRIKPPRGWAIKEGDGPNVVKKFEGPNLFFIVQTKNQVTFATRSAYREKYSDEATLRNFVAAGMKGGRCGSGSKLMGYGLETVAVHPAIKVTYKCNKEKVGVEITMFISMWTILYEDKMVVLTGAAFSEIDFKNAQNTFLMMVMSASFPEQFN
jgi:hypothetical protein